MSTVIILLILCVIIVFAMKSSIKHMKGQGDCCGGGSNEPKSTHKKLYGKIVSKKIIKIEGMHCDNCKNKVENSLNNLDGVLAKVNLRKKEAIVSMSIPLSNDVLKSTIENLDFTVKDIIDCK